MTEQDKWQDKVNKLLRMAEDPNLTEEHRANLQDKVVHLMAKYAIDETLLNKQNGTSPVMTFITVQTHGSYSYKRRVLLNGISDVFGCHMVNIHGTQIAKVFGYPSDLEKVVTLFNSLLIQMFIGLSQHKVPSWENKKTAHSAFMNGYVSTVLKRCRAAFKRAVEETESTGKELVLADKAKMAENLAKSSLGKLVASGYRSSSRSNSYYDGVAAGQRADIGQTRVSSHKLAINGL